MLEDLGIDEANSEDEVVPLPNVNSAILRKVIQFCTYHKDDPVPSSTDDDENKEKRTDDITSWDADFLKVCLIRMLIKLAKFIVFFFFIRSIKELSLNWFWRLTTWIFAVCWMLHARLSPIWSKERLQMKFARPSISKTTSHQPKKNKSARKTPGMFPKFFFVYLSQLLFLLVSGAKKNNWIREFIFTKTVRIISFSLS